MAVKRRVFMVGATAVFLCLLCMVNAMTPTNPAIFDAGHHSRDVYGWNLPWPDEAQFPFRVKGLRDILHMDLTVLVQEGTNATTTTNLTEKANTTTTRRSNRGNSKGFRSSLQAAIQQMLSKHFHFIEFQTNPLPSQRASLPFRVGKNIRLFLDEADLLRGKKKSKSKVFQEVSPSVAHIQLSLRVRKKAESVNETKQASCGEEDLEEEDHLEDEEFAGEDVFSQQESSGTGFLWDNRGHVVTCFHVIEDLYNNGVVGGSIRLKFQGIPTLYNARVLGVEPDKDIAILKVTNLDKKTPTFLPKPVKLGKSRRLKNGQSVHAIGSVGFLETALTSGVVYSLGQQAVGMNSLGVLNKIEGGVRVDISIHAGFSGGPLLDCFGRVVAMHIGSNDAMKLAYAMPVDTVRRVANQVIQSGRVTTPALGVSVFQDNNIVDFAIQKNGFHPGIPVVNVVPGSPASVAGIRPARLHAEGCFVSDFISAIDRKPVKKLGDLISVIDAKCEGEEVELSLLRLNVRFGEYSAVMATVNVTARDKLFQHLATNTTPPYFGNCSSVYL